MRLQSADPLPLVRRRCRRVRRAGGVGDAGGVGFTDGIGIVPRARDAEDDARDRGGVGDVGKRIGSDVVVDGEAKEKTRLGGRWVG